MTNSTTKPEAADCDSDNGSVIGDVGVTQFTSPSYSAQSRLLRDLARVSGAQYTMLLAHNQLINASFVLAGTQLGAGAHPLAANNGLVQAVRSFCQDNPATCCEPGLWSQLKITKLLPYTAGILTGDVHVCTLEVCPPTRCVRISVLLMDNDGLVDTTLWQQQGVADCLMHIQAYLKRWPAYVLGSQLHKGVIDAFFSNPLHLTLDSAFEAILVLDQEERVLFANSACYDLFNLGTVRVLGWVLSDLISWQSYSAMTGLIQKSWLQSPSPPGVIAHSGSVRLTLSEHSQITARFRTQQLSFKKSKCLLIRFLREQPQSLSLAESSGTFPQVSVNQLLSMAPVGILQVDSRWRCVYINHELGELAGVSEVDLKETDWPRIFHIADRTRVLAQIRRHLSRLETYEDRVRLCSPLGQVRWVKCRVKPVQSGDGHDPGFIATFMDIDEQMRLELDLRLLSECDVLTGLMSRGHFMEKARECLSDRRVNQHLALFYIDLDKFKQVNDTFGHDVGDLLLKEAAQRMQMVLRRGDLIARIGGDEFLVLLQDVLEPVVFRQLADKLIEALSQPFMLGGQQVVVSASIGVAATLTRDPSALSLEGLIKEADVALYRAKQGGRNHYRLCSSLFACSRTRGDVIRSDLQLAFERGQFCLAYQPVVKSASVHEVLSIEGFLRWNHPELGEVPPAEFIPFMEDAGLIHFMGLSVLKQALSAWSNWRQEGVITSSVSMSVNVSPLQLRSPNFFDSVMAVIENANVPPTALILELTEAALVEHIDPSACVIRQLQSRGVRFALDDFGSGVSSLSQLNRYSLDVIKIDKMFVANCLKRSQEKAITRAIINLARDLRMLVIAEGVESQACLAELRALQCEAVQGNWISPALDVEACGKWLAQSRQSDVTG